MRRPVLALTVSALALGLAAPALAHPALAVALDHAERLHVASAAGSVMFHCDDVSASTSRPWLAASEPR